MSTKHERMAALAAPYAAEGLDARYAGFFALFNQQKFYEAHDVLEDLWLADRRGANGDFYKGLIQLAGAFVHLQKHRRRPAAAVLALARANLEKYPEQHERLDLVSVRQLAEQWQQRMEATNPLDGYPAPEIHLSEPGGLS